MLKVPEQYWSSYSVDCMTLTQSYIQKGNTNFQATYSHSLGGGDAGAMYAHSHSSGQTGSTFTQSMSRGQAGTYYGITPRQPSISSIAEHMRQYPYSVSNRLTYPSSATTGSIVHLTNEGPIFNSLTANAALGAPTTLGSTVAMGTPGRLLPSSSMNTGQHGIGVNTQYQASGFNTTQQAGGFNINQSEVGVDITQTVAIGNQQQPGVTHNIEHEVVRENIAQEGINEKVDQTLSGDNERSHCANKTVTHGNSQVEGAVLCLDSDNIVVTSEDDSVPIDTTTVNISFTTQNVIPDV